MSEAHDDYQSEPVRGLPAILPPGERMLWQGAPAWWPLACQVFHIRAIAIYFALLMAWRAAVRYDPAHDVRAAEAAVLSLLPVTLFGLGLLALLAWLSSRTTVYTVTDRRVVMRTGVAIPTAINLPFKVIAAADLRLSGDGTGDIPFVLAAEDRVPYSQLWPHVRPWRLRQPEPMLRAIRDPRRVASLIAGALQQAHPGSTARLPPEPAGHVGVVRQGGALVNAG